MICSFLILLLAFLTVNGASSTSRKRGRNSSEDRTNELLKNQTAELLALASADPSIPAALRAIDTAESTALANKCTMMNEAVRNELSALMRDCSKFVHIMIDVKEASLLITQFLTSNELHRLFMTTKLLSRLELSDGWIIDRRPEFINYQRLLYSSRISKAIGKSMYKDPIINRLLRWAYHHDYQFAQHILSLYPLVYFFHGRLHHSSGGVARNVTHFDCLISDPQSPKGKLYAGFRDYLFKNVKLKYPFEEYDVDDESIFWARVLVTHLKDYLTRNPADVKFKQAVQAVNRRYPNPYQSIYK